MAGVDLMTFEDAIESSNVIDGGRTVLLGNGFSIDWDPDTFLYDSLFDEAELADLTVDKIELFDTLGSSDFEHVVERLKAAFALADLYEIDKDTADRLRDDAKAIQRGLADVLAARHPGSSSSVTSAEAESARTFLANFGRIYTLSYDLLLYWVLNRSVGPSVPRGDGFEWPTAQGGPLIWKRSAARRGQQVFYLHGALHLFVEDRRLHKLSFNRHGHLVEELRARIDEGQYPLVVTEGISAEKEERIDRSAYLRYCHHQFSELSGSLFIHGMSLSENDDHILAPLEAKQSQVEALYVGVHGDPRRGSARRLIERARDVAERRSDVGGRNLEVHFYDAATAHVWRS